MFTFNINIQYLAFGKSYLSFCMFCFSTGDGPMELLAQISVSVTENKAEMRFKEWSLTINSKSSWSKTL